MTSSFGVVPRLMMARRDKKSCNASKEILGAIFGTDIGGVYDTESSESLLRLEASLEN